MIITMLTTEFRCYLAINENENETFNTNLSVTWLPKVTFIKLHLLNDL